MGINSAVIVQTIPATAQSIVTENRNVVLAKAGDTDDAGSCIATCIAVRVTLANAKIKIAPVKYREKYDA